VALIEDPGDYCRQIEAYLCRRNGGHLIRIVGPAFERVSAWAARGIPLAVACRGIDEHCDRYYAAGARRRPVRIEFCEADVLDAFDRWRRAVGLAALDTPDGGGQAPDARPQASLPAHLDRLIARLTARRTGDGGPLDRALDEVVAELDRARVDARTLRGEARSRLIERLSALDRRLVEAVRAEADAATMLELEAEAEAELAPFRKRMPPDAVEASTRACVVRLLRDRFRVPMVTYE
jgi:hypothetical protein